MKGCRVCICHFHICHRLCNIRIFSSFSICKHIYSRLSLSRSRRDPQKQFEISVVRHIRFSELRKIQIAQPNFTNEYVIRLLYLDKYIMKTLWKRGEIAPQEQFLLFFTILYNLILDFCVITRTRFSLRDKRLFEVTEVEITRVDCIIALLTFSSPMMPSSLLSEYPHVRSECTHRHT